MAYLELFNENTLALKCSYGEREIAKSIGDYKWDPSEKKWIFPLNREVVDKARQVFGGIAIEPQILTHLRLLDSFQAKVQKIKKFKDCHVDESFCQEFEKCCCFDEMGLGKSFIAIYMATWRKTQGKLKKCIILAPKSCKESIWGRQIEKFTDEKSLVVNGTPSKRDKLYKQYLKRDVLFLIFSYETFRVDFEKLKEI